VRIQVARRYGTFEVVFVLDSSGNGHQDLDEPPLGSAWLIERVLISGSGTGTVEVRVGGKLRDIGVFDPAIQAAVADNPSPIYVPQQERVRIRVRGGDASAVITGYVQYRVLEESEG
jgi:hypothetical protein